MLHFSKCCLWFKSRPLFLFISNCRFLLLGARPEPGHEARLGPRLLLLLFILLPWSPRRLAFHLARSFSSSSSSFLVVVVVVEAELGDVLPRHEVPLHPALQVGLGRGGAGVGARCVGGEALGVGLLELFFFFFFFCQG